MPPFCRHLACNKCWIRMKKAICAVMCASMLVASCSHSAETVNLLKSQWSNNQKKINMTTEEKMSESFTYNFESSKSPKTVYETLLDINAWWSGLYGEEIKGTSNKLNGEFTFQAGGGAHYSKQKLIELVPNKKIVWLVTESNLSFLKKQEEWTNTKLCFDISRRGNKTIVAFTHQDLVPKIECYESCSGAWTRYLENLAKQLK